MKTMPIRKGAASKTYKGMAQGHGMGIQSSWEMVVAPSGTEQQVTSTRGLEIPQS